MTPPTSTRKQREIAEREERILDVSLAMLVDQGYIGLTMDKIAAEMEYSKGTIYQHFCCKEDVVAGILVRSAGIRAELFERAATFHGTTRERIGAVGAAAEIFWTLYPHHYQAENLVQANSIREKADKLRTDLATTKEHRCFEVATAIIAEAVAQGDLALRSDQRAEQVAIGLWSLYTGAFKMGDFLASLGDPDLANPTTVMLGNANLFLDGCGWQPLSSEHDYAAARQRALREVFSSEARRAGLI